MEVLENFVTESYIRRLDIVQKSLWISSHFGTENYAWILDIVQNFSCLIFGIFCPKIYITEYLKQFSTENYTWRLVIVQNVQIPRILLISLDQNVSIVFVNNIYIGNIRAFWHRKLYIKTYYSSKSLWILIIFLV